MSNIIIQVLDEPVVIGVENIVETINIEYSEGNGIDGISQYQSYLNTTLDNPKLTEAQWSAPINEVYIGTTPPASAKLWFDTTPVVSTENPPIVTPPPVVVPAPEVIPPTSYVLADFGENAINNHAGTHGAHSEKVQTIFNYVTRDFRDRCTSFQTYNNTFFNYGTVLASQLLDKASAVDADIIFVPYVNAAYWMNGQFYDFVLPVGSHYDNDGTDGIIGNYDQERHDITANANTFLSDSIAVSARRDIPVEFKKSTSWGLGMEFFEDCSPEALNPYYPDKDVPLCFWECNTNIDGTVLSNARTQTNSQTIDPSFSIGQEIWVVKLDGVKEYTTITSFIDSDNFNIFPAITPIVGTTLYSWHNDTLGAFVGGQAQSWAVPLVAGKLKVIKMTTGATWDTVRAAARATAKRNPTGIPEIDNATWDMWRGFGCIDVQAARNYINNGI